MGTRTLRELTRRPTPNRQTYAFYEYEGKIEEYKGTKGLILTFIQNLFLGLILRIFKRVPQLI